MINQEILSKIINGKFELDCPEIILTQNTTNDPNGYKGPGWIYQNNDRELVLKMFHGYECQKDAVNEFKSVIEGINKLKPGKILSDETYYSLQATNINGTTWSADYIEIKGNTSLITGSRVIKTKIKKIIKIDENEDKNEKFFIRLFALGDFNEYVKREIEIEGNNYSIKLKPYADYLFITTSGVKENYEPYLTELIIEALSIFFGIMIVPIVTIEPNGNFNQTIIRSIKKNSEPSKILGPIRIPHHIKPADLQNFVNCYIHEFKKAESKHEVFFGYWHKIYQSCKGSIETMALSVSISIEGILKNFFETYGLDRKFSTEEIDSALDVIKDIKSKEFKSYLRSHLGQMKSKKRQVPKSALIELSGEGLFDKDIIDIWNRVRGKTAHADQLNIDEDDLQKYLDDNHACLYLFYQLLFIIIGYKGPFINYVKDGWPDDLR